MTSKKELKVAYYLAIILFVVGVVCYAAFPPEQPEQPVRLLFKGVAGNVVFDHKTHASGFGYGLSCNDCHHHPGEEEADSRACGACHLPKKSKGLSNACGDCHEPDEIEGFEMVNKTDAFHNQCIKCHDQYEAGAKECSECHVM